MFIRHKGGGVRRRRVLRTRRRRTWSTSESAHYMKYKEAARALVHERLLYWNQFYDFSYKRVSIKNARSRWGSCSSKGNLNFNYRILFLPSELQDYLLVHELCHLQEMNHGPQFWALVAEQVPEYEQCVLQLRRIEKDYFNLTLLPE